MHSIGIPLQLCTLTNADFDGDEVWALVPMTKKRCEEAEEEWKTMCKTDPPSGWTGAALSPLSPLYMEQSPT